MCSQPLRKLAIRQGPLCKRICHPQARRCVQRLGLDEGVGDSSQPCRWRGLRRWGLAAAAGGGANGWCGSGAAAAAVGGGGNEGAMRSAIETELSNYSSWSGLRRESCTRGDELASRSLALGSSQAAPNSLYARQSAIGALGSTIGCAACRRLASRSLPTTTKPAPCHI